MHKYRPSKTSYKVALNIFTLFSVGTATNFSEVETSKMISNERELHA